MSGNFYEVSENRSEKVSFPPRKEAEFCSSYLEVRVFNVGSGEAILLTLPGRETAWVIDCGCHHNQDLGQALANYLKAEGLKLTGIILSHPHYDHGGAIETLVQKAPLGNTVTYYRSQDSYYHPAKPWIERLNKQLKALGSRLDRVIVKQNKMIEANLGNGVRARMFSGKRVSGGYTSIFLYLRYKAARLLFTGDVTCGYEVKLLTEFLGSAFRADVLKVTHHGSSSGTGKRLVCSVSPGIAIASTSADSGHRLEQDTLARLGGRPGKRKVLETHVDGDIILQTDGRFRDCGVLYHVERDRPGQFANQVEAATQLLGIVNQSRTKRRHAGCVKDC